LEECLKDLLYELEHLEDRLSLTRRRILASIPGVGPVTATTIIGEIGDIA